MVKIGEHKELRARIHSLIKVQKNHARYMEPLQGKALQVNLNVVASYIEVKQILEVNTARTQESILAQSL